MQYLIGQFNILWYQFLKKSPTIKKQEEEREKEIISSKKINIMGKIKRIYYMTT